MELSLMFIKILMDFLDSGQQNFESVKNLTLVSRSLWRFIYEDLDGTTYLCKILPSEDVQEYENVAFSSKEYGLSIVIVENLTCQ